jgi:hypothetical protein
MRTHQATYVAEPPFENPLIEVLCAADSASSPGPPSLKPHPASPAVPRGFQSKWCASPRQGTPTPRLRRPRTIWEYPRQLRQHFHTLRHSVDTVACIPYASGVGPRARDSQWQYGEAGARWSAGTSIGHLRGDRGCRMRPEHAQSHHTIRSPHLHGLANRRRDRTPDDHSGPPANGIASADRHAAGPDGLRRQHRRRGRVPTSDAGPGRPNQGVPRGHLPDHHRR